MPRLRLGPTLRALGGEVIVRLPPRASSLPTKRRGYGIDKCAAGRSLHRCVPGSRCSREDWDTLKQLAKDDMIKVDGLVLSVAVRRQDPRRRRLSRARKGAKWGAVGGAVVGLIFPPALLASAAVERASGPASGARLPRPEGGDPGGRRGRPAAQQLRDRRDLRGAVGRRRRQRPVQRKERHQEKVDRDSADEVKAAAGE